MLYQKELPILGQYDVVVGGGGVAGFCAAMQAARAGARTALVEQYGMLGGIMTGGGNPEIGLFYRGNRPVIAGIGWELVQRLAKAGWASIPEFSAEYAHSQQNVRVNGPMAAAYMDAMCEEAGVHLLLHHTLSDALTEDGRVRGVVLTTKSGLQILKGTIFIDATGDGDLAALSGADFQLGEDTIPPESSLQPGTLRFYWDGYTYTEDQREIIIQAFRSGLEKGELLPADCWNGSDTAYTIFADNGNNVHHIALNGADSQSRCAAEREARRSLERIAAWARGYIPGAEQIRPVACGTEVAARESRRIVGDHIITVEEYVGAESYPDGVYYSYYPVDLHGMGEQALRNIAVRPDAVPQIPLSALLVRNWKNLMAVGRCASGDRLAQSAFRVKASCMAMGQAAGAAAGLAIKRGKPLRDIPAAEIRAYLREQGAIVPDFPG